LRKFITNTKKDKKKTTKRCTERTSQQKTNTHQPPGYKHHSTKTPELPNPEPKQVITKTRESEENEGFEQIARQPEITYFLDKLMVLKLTSMGGKLSLKLLTRDKTVNLTSDL
jgi:hypothetical protein